MSVTSNKNGFLWISSIFNKLFGSKKKRGAAINEVLFYGIDKEEDRKQIGLNNLFCIYYVIIHTRKSIDVCMPSLVSDTIAKCLIYAQQNNKVKVRVIIHNSSDFHNLQPLAQNGIEVKMTSVADRLEHEFILIDALEQCEGGVAVIGSLDYDSSRVNCNSDATMITSEGAVVRTLQKEFVRIWDQRELDRLPTTKT